MIQFINFIRKKLREKQKHHYNSALIQRLQKDHKKLLKLFEKLENKPTKKNFYKFQKELDLHLLLEDSNLYTYLEIKYSFCNLDSIIEVRNNIKKIIPRLNQILVLIEKNENQKKLLGKIKNYFIKRIELEEKILFDLYEYKNIFTCNEIKEKIQKIKEL